MLDQPAGQAGAVTKILQGGEGTPLPGGLQAGNTGLAKAVNVVKTQPDTGLFNHALGPAVPDVNRQNGDAVASGIAHQHGRAPEAHGLVIEQGCIKSGRLVIF